MRDFTIDILWTRIQTAVTALGGFLGYFLGGSDGLMIALVIFMALDYLTGVMVGIAEKQLSSAVGYRGLARKVCTILMVGVANVVDTQVIGSGSALRGAVICFYLSNEGLSLMENAARLGLPIPEKLRDILAQLHDRGDSEKKPEEIADANAGIIPAPAPADETETAAYDPIHDRGDSEKKPEGVADTAADAVPAPAAAKEEAEHAEGR